MYIYKITNKINNKIYIGQTYNKTIYDRFNRHIKEANANSKSYIDRAINNYGKDNFICELIDTAKTLQELNQKEIYWIDYYNSTNKNIGYNFNYGRDDQNYVTHISADEEQNAIAYETWKKEGYPEVLLMQPDLSDLYDADELSMRDYVLAYYAPCEMVWKNTSEYYVNYIYVRRDVVEKLGIEEHVY